jgi:anti-sigma regulatory factor (Ser/Thr protein kinase)
MTVNEEIEAAYLALEAFLSQTEWSEIERERLKLAVMEAILIKRHKRRKSNK